VRDIFDATFLIRTEGYVENAAPLPDVTICLHALPSHGYRVANLLAAEL